MIYITDIALFSEVLNVVVIPIVAYFAYKTKQYKPQIAEAKVQVNEAVSVAEDIYEKSSMILPLFDKLQKLTYDYTNAAASGNISKGDISNEDAQRLIADIKIIADDQAVLEFRKMIEGYTCRP